jgi:hypothetical protein
MTDHPSPALVNRYAAGDRGVDDVTAWSIELHLDDCAHCRAVVADGVDEPVLALLGRVADAVDRGIDAGPAPVAARRRLLGRTGTAGAVLPWLLTAVGLLGTASLAQRLSTPEDPLVLLVAPLAPLLPVAAAWARGNDPAWEIVSSAPRAGLAMLLRRTLAVLLVLMPFLAVAGALVGDAPVMWLLPCLAFTVGSLALGGVIGVTRAAAILAGVWSAGVIVPCLVTSRVPAVLQTGSWALWAAALAVLLAVLLLRADDHRRPASRY